MLSAAGCVLLVPVKTFWNESVLHELWPVCCDRHNVGVTYFKMISQFLESALYKVYMHCNFYTENAGYFAATPIYPLDRWILFWFTWQQQMTHLFPKPKIQLCINIKFRGLLVVCLQLSHMILDIIWKSKHQE